MTFYAPLDFSWATRRAVKQIRPTVLALVELELWPNLIRAAKRDGAQVAIINARLSSRSYRGYRSLRLRCNRHSTESTSWPRKMENMHGDLWNWGFPATGSALPVP